MLRRIVLPLILAIACDGSSGVMIRRGGPPVPTTFAGLRALSGPSPTGKCVLPAVARAADWSPVAAPSDSLTLLLPAGWRAEEPIAMGVDWPFRNDTLQPVLPFAHPPDSRFTLQRELTRGRGRSWLQRRQKDAPMEGPTCELDRGQAGAIWSFYAPDSAELTWPRPYAAKGDLMTAAGRWYSASLRTASEPERLRLVSVLTEALLAPR